MTAELLRPHAAAARFGVSERTLRRWAASGLIGWSKVGRVKEYAASDIADLFAANASRRSVVPMVPVQPPADDWESSPFWTAPARRERSR